MEQQLFWIETLLKLAGGLVLIFLPLTTARLLGLGAATSGLWPRLAGALLIGLAAALFIEGRGTGSHGYGAAGHRMVGLGMAGVVLLNVAGAGILLAHLVLGGAAPTRRGNIVLSSLLVVLALLVALEIAYV